MMPHERRLSVRKIPEYFAYLSLPFNNGGVVLDVSEGGLSFQSIAPVKADGPIHIRFAIDSSKRMRAIGELAWIDETGKNGGLRFTELSDEVREQIRVWAGQVNAGANARAKTTAKARVLDIPIAGPAIEAIVAPANKVDWAPVVATGYPLLYNLKAPVNSAPSYALSMFPPELDSEAVTTAVTMPPSIALRHPIAAVGLTIALAIVVSIGIFAYVSTSGAGQSLFDWGEKMWSGFSSRPIPRAPAPPASSTPESSRMPRR